MRVCIEKSTGKLIESQSGGEVEVSMEMAEVQLIAEGVEDIDQDEIVARYRALRDDADVLEYARLDTLLQNALNAGYAEADIEVSYITDAEFAVIMEAMKPIPTYADLRKAEYPTCADYLDGIVKGDQDQIDKYIADCLAIKEKYPK